jgi:hypothetical protein
MIDEFREYTFTAQAWEEYWDLFVNLCLPIRKDDYGVLRGMWQERLGESVIFRHLWRYDSLDERARLRGELLKVDAWRNDFLPQAGARVSRQFLQVLNPRVDGGIESLAPARYLHLYRCPTGKAGAAIEQISDAVGRGRQQVCGLWATEFADPNQVTVLSAHEAAPQVDVQACVPIETHCIQPLSIRCGR